MENYFLKRYKGKSEQELKLIVHNQKYYQPEAVSAAIKLLNAKNELEIPIPEKLEDKNIESEDYSFGVLPLSFDYKPFVRTLSYREFLTGLTLALLFHAIFQIIDYYSNERIFENSLREWKISVFVLVFLANHAYYKLEHRRSNNFIGRSLNDLILLILLILSKASYEFILNSRYSLSLDLGVVGGSLLIVGVVLVIFAFETAVALLKFLLRQVRCQIF